MPIAGSGTANRVGTEVLSGVQADGCQGALLKSHSSSELITCCSYQAFQEEW